MYMLYLISVLGTNPRKSMELAEKCFESFQMLHVCKIYLHVSELPIAVSGTCWNGLFLFRDRTNCTLQHQCLVENLYPGRYPYSHSCPRWYDLICFGPTSLHAMFREVDHTWSMWDFCLPALVVTNSNLSGSLVWKNGVSLCSDITSARKKPFESYPQEGAEPLQTRSTLKQREGGGGSSQKTIVPLFLGPRLASRHGRFEVSASWRVGTPENLVETKRNPLVHETGGGKWRHRIWCLWLAGCLI